MENISSHHCVSSQYQTNVWETYNGYVCSASLIQTIEGLCYNQTVKEDNDYCSFFYC